VQDAAITTQPQLPAMTASAGQIWIPPTALSRLRKPPTVSRWAETP